MNIDDLFSSTEIKAATQLAADVHTPSVYSNKDCTLMLDVCCDFDMDFLNKKLDGFKEYVIETIANIHLTVEASRTVELVLPPIEIVTPNKDYAEQIREAFPEDIPVIYDSKSGGYSVIYFRFRIYENFCQPVQLMRFISQLFENTRNRKYYDHSNRDIYIYRSNGEYDNHISTQDINFKKLITETRHEKHKRRKNFSERTAFQKILNISQYVMLGRRTGIEIYKRACSKFRQNMDIELLTAAHTALANGNMEDAIQDLSNISDIEGFLFLNAHIKLIDICYQSLVWWKSAQFIFVNTYKAAGYEVYDFDSSGHRTEHAVDLFDQCNKFFDFEFPFNSTFQAGFVYNKIEENYYFALVIKLGPICTPKVNDGGAYETAFIYKERIKEPDVQLSVIKFRNMICDALKTEYMDEYFRRDVRYSLENNFKKVLNESKHR